MRLSESCACGAGFTAEDGDRDTLRQEITEWRAQHFARCHVDHLRRSAGTTSGLFEIGFRQRVDPVVPLAIAAPIAQGD